jgi:DNA-binding response OmpR family regulator
MSAILLVGEDELLQQTRAAVLRTTGAETISVPASRALEIQEERQCDVVILCHSLTPGLCATLAGTIRLRWPNTRVLLVSSTSVWEHADAHGAVDAVTSADPERLVLRTVELLGHRPPQTVGARNFQVAASSKAGSRA